MQLQCVFQPLHVIIVLAALKTQLAMFRLHAYSVSRMTKRVLCPYNSCWYPGIQSSINNLTEYSWSVFHLQ